MNASVRERLQDILTTYKDNQRAAALKEEQQLRAEQTFVASFVNVRDQVIQPVLEDVREFLQSEGHTSRIVRHTGDPSTTSYPDPLSFVYVALLIFRADVPEEEYRTWSARDRDETSYVPQVKFAADIKQQQIIVYVSALVPGTESHGGPVRTYTLSEITHAVVEHEVLEGIKRIFTPIRIPRRGSGF